MDRYIKRVLFAALAGLALVSCSGDDDDVTSAPGPQADGEETPRDGPEDQTDVPDVGAEGSDDDFTYAVFESPLQAAFGISSDPEQLEEQFDEQERERQQFVAECMAAEGFEYTPVDSSQIEIVGPGGGDLSEREYVEEYGFGISTTFLEGFEGPGEDFEDPNLEYVQSLSTEEQEAYNRALYGDGFSIEPGSGEAFEVTPDALAEQGGCFNDAFAAVQDPFQELFTEFGDELLELFQRVQADPRITEANGRWSECIADAGYSYDSPEDMFNDLNERMAPFYDGAFGSGPADVVTEEGAGSEGIVVQGGSGSEPQLTPEELAELEELQAFELEVALANYECQQPILEATFEVQAEYEQQFLDENRAAIDELLAD